MTQSSSNLRSWLRALPVFPEQIPHFDTGELPDAPEALFLEWLESAVAAGQPAAHAACLSTSGSNAVPSARYLILKDVDERGWQFASHRTSPKGRDLTDNPVAALTFFWPATGRQIRLTGAVTALPPEESARDFLARPLSSRAATLIGHQSEPLEATEDYEVAVSAALQHLKADDTTVDEAWTLYALAPSRVEFWQASADREHTRVLYRKQGDTWETTLLWP
jgi:pyridoxamine 5'-phosphate oxidase